MSICAYMQMSFRVSEKLKSKQLINNSMHVAFRFVLSHFNPFPFSLCISNWSWLPPKIDRIVLIEIKGKVSKWFCIFVRLLAEIHCLTKENGGIVCGFSIKKGFRKCGQSHHNKQIRKWTNSSPIVSCLQPPISWINRN